MMHNKNKSDESDDRHDDLRDLLSQPYNTACCMHSSPHFGTAEGAFVSSTGCIRVQLGRKSILWLGFSAQLICLQTLMNRCEDSMMTCVCEPVCE